MKGKILIPVLMIGSLITAYAQDVTSSKFGKGIAIQAADSSFSMKFSMRFQTLYDGTFDTGSKEWNDKLLIRRSRLKFDGYVFSPKLEYKVELGISNRDHGGEIAETSNTSNVVMDAVAKWNFKPSWELWFGQTKLPGNRERVISSQKLQFVDRSLVNSYFNIDRDIGVQLHGKHRLGNMTVKEIASVSMGEGRNITSNNAGGYDYTFRLEFLPFGDFASSGDYFGSDLKRESNPKLSVGVTYDFNDDASRQMGQLGSFIQDSGGNRIYTDLSTIFVDAMFKYNGIQFMTEYANKKNLDQNTGVTGPGTFAGFYSGSGFVGQLGYLFNNNIELAGRYTTVRPEDVAFSKLPEETEYTFGLSKYFVEHSLKIQSDISLLQSPGADDEIAFRLQMEISF